MSRLAGTRQAGGRAARGTGVEGFAAPAEVMNPLQIDCAALMHKTVFWLRAEPPGMRPCGALLQEGVRAMHLTEADVWVIVPMGLAVTFMLWFILKLAGQLKKRKTESDRETDRW